jgi:iron(III) transport system substrate-binding protein
MKYYPLTAFVTLLSIAFLGGCSGGVRNEVNIYTHRHYDSDQQTYDEFEKKTGIKVNVVKASADQLIQRLAQEGENTPADVLITIDAGRLYRAKAKGLLQPVKSAILEANIPAYLRDPQGFWYGLTYRSRVIAYAKDRVNPADIATYASLADSRWRGKLLVQSSDNQYNQSLLASIIAHEGLAKAKEWAQGVANNMAHEPKGNDIKQVEDIQNGLADIAIVNSYYVARLYNYKDEEVKKNAQGIGIVFPEQDGRGAHINISGIAMAKYSHHPENARKLMEYLSEKEAQSSFTTVNYEYPANAAVTLPSILQQWGPFKKDTLNLDKLGIYNTDAVKIFDEVGWK